MISEKSSAPVGILLISLINILRSIFNIVFFSHCFDNCFCSFQVERFPLVSVKFLTIKFMVLTLAEFFRSIPVRPRESSICNLQLEILSLEV